jgi:nitrogen regulatory protein P-II 1
MLKVEALIQPFKLDDVRAALESLGIGQWTISHVLHHDASNGAKVFYRGGESDADRPRIRIELVVAQHRLDEVIDAVSCAARSDVSADNGTILVYEIADGLRIRNGRRTSLAIAD